MKKFSKIAILALAAMAAVPMTAKADLEDDLTTTATTIKADLAAGQTQALPIFAIMFGVPLVLAFFKRVAH